MPDTPLPANGGDTIKVVPDQTLSDKSAADISGMLDALMVPVEEAEAPEPEPAEALPPAPAEEPAPVEAAPPGPTSDERLADLQLLMEEESLRRQQLEAKLEHERLLRERANTKAGTLNTIARDLLREGRTPPPEEAEYADEASPVRQELVRMQQEMAAYREEATTRASQDTLAAFVRDTQDLAMDTDESRKLLDEMKPHVAKARQDYSAFFESGDPKLVRETTRLILKSAYVEAKAARLAGARASAAEKRAQQFAERGKTVAAAAISGTGAAPPARPKPKTDSDLTAAEAAAKLDEMARRAGLAR